MSRRRASFPDTGYSPGFARRALHAVLDVVAPRRGAVARHRARLDGDPVYREAFDAYTQVRHYESARTKGASTAWSSAWPTSADAEILLDLPTLRARSRESVRNDAVGCGVVRAFRDGVVGSGVDMRSSTGDRDVDERIDRAWNRLKDDLFPAEGVSWRYQG